LVLAPSGAVADMKGITLKEYVEQAIATAVEDDEKK
jgi:hypothetical protein